MIVESYEDVIVLSGSLTHNHWETIHTAISLVLKRHPSGVILDLSQVTSVTPEGAETFHDAINYVHKHKEARVVVAAVPASVLEVLRAVPDVRSQLPMAETVEDARLSIDVLGVAADEKKKKKEKVYQRKILACVCPESSDDYLVTIVSDLVDKNATKVILLIPVIVPRELPLQSPMPELEHAASVYAGIARARMDSAGVGYEVIVQRGRDFATLVQETAAEIDAAHVILGLPTNRAQDEQSGKMVKSLFDKVSRPLIFARGKVQP